MQGPLEYASRIAYSSKEVLQFTYDMAVKYKDSPGVYVECGVAAGAQIIAMAAGAPNKTIYAFDSFEGIPLPSNKDDQMPGIKFLSKEEQSKLPNPGKQALITTGATAVPLEHFIEHLDAALPDRDRKNILPRMGWFEETVQHFNKPIAILRLDGDLYNSTYVCLKYLYPKVIKGGICIIDDWALRGCKQAVYDYFYSLPEYQSLNSQTFADFAIISQVNFIKDQNSCVAWWIK
jgi:O-methyltransferase